MSNKNYDCSQITQNRKATCSNNNYYYTTISDNVVTIIPVEITNPQTDKNVTTTSTTGLVVKDSTTGENLRLSGNTISSGNVGGGGSIYLNGVDDGGIFLTSGVDGAVNISAGTNGVNVSGDDITITSNNSLTLSGGLQPIVIDTSTIDAHSANLTANSFIKQGGTNLQYLMADGSITTNSGANNNSNIYLYKNNSTAHAPPIPSGDIVYNSAVSQDATTILYISHLTRPAPTAVDIDVFLAQINITSVIYLQDQNDSTNYIYYDVTGATTIIPNNYVSVPVLKATSAGTGSTSFGSGHNIIMSIFTNSVEVNNRITTLETKTQNIDALTTVAGTTNFTGRIDMNVVGASNKINIGSNTGLSGQGNITVAIGNNAGRTNQGASCIAIGNSAGMSNTSGRVYTIGIGASAGGSDQGNYGIGIGYQAGYSSQGNSSIAIGNNAGSGALGTGQGISCIAIGNQAGSTAQNNNAVAIGNLSGNSGQLSNAVAIGTNAGQTSQGASSIAIGYLSGNSGQLANAVAIGSSAGNLNQGASSVAIGNLAGNGTCVANSIVLNGSGVALPAPNPAFYVAPIRAFSTQANSGTLRYDTTSKEIYYAPITNTLTFSFGSITILAPNIYYFGDIPDNAPQASNVIGRTRIMSSFSGRITSVNVMNYAGTTQGSGENCPLVLYNNTAGTSVSITTAYLVNTSTILNFPLATPLAVALNDTLTVSIQFPTMVTYPSALRMRVVATITTP